MIKKIFLIKYIVIRVYIFLNTRILFDYFSMETAQTHLQHLLHSFQKTKQKFYVPRHNLGFHELALAQNFAPWTLAFELCYHLQADALDKGVNKIGKLDSLPKKTS